MSLDKKYLYFALVLSLVITVYAASYIYLGSLLSAVIGVSGLLGLVAWRITTFKVSMDTWPIVPWYILTIVILIGNHTEAYAAGYPQAIVNFFPNAFPDLVVFNDFIFLAVFPLAAVTIYLLGAVGLVMRHLLGDYMAWYTYFFAIVWGFSHFLFLFITGANYIPGVGTALLPVGMGFYGITQLLTGYRTARGRVRAANLALKGQMNQL